MTKKLIISLFCSILWLSTYGQQFPVQAQLQMLPPHSPYLDDWGGAVPNKMLLMLTLVDGFENGYPVRLRWTISGNGIELQSTQNFTPTPITLNFGVPRAIMGVEVAQYLNPDNLEFTGLARNDFISQGGKLPEGLYTVCVEVLDFNRFEGFPVSAPACFMMVASELDPPMILAPTGLIDPLPVQNVLLQWQPTHVGGFPVNYKVQIFEKVEGMSNDLVLQTQVPFYENTVMMQQSLLYGAAEPPLTLGKEYIFLVQIIDPLGNNAFKNNGYSQFVTFTYGEEAQVCNWEAVAMEATRVGGASFVANWEAMEDAESYRLDVGKDTFFESYVDGFVDFEVIDSTHFNIFGLEAETDYWYRVRAVKTLENGEACVSENSNVIPVKVKAKCTQPPEDEDVAYECGLPTDMSLKEAPLIASLAKGDSIYAAGFKVVLTEIGGGAGSFFGAGYVANIPFLADKIGNKVRVNVKFEGISVNENCQLVDGEIFVTGAGAAIVSEELANKISGIVDVLETVDDVLAATEEVLETIDAIIAEAEGYLPAETMQDLVDAQNALADAKAAHETAVASGDPEAIAAAEQAVEDAKDQLKEATEQYKKDLKEFFTKLLAVVKDLMKELLKECLINDLKGDFVTALKIVKDFVSFNKNKALTEIPNYPNQSLAWEDTDEETTYELELIEEGTGELDDFYEKEKTYMICDALDKLDGQLTSEEDAKQLGIILKDIGYDLLQKAGKEIQAEKTVEAIVAILKTDAIEALEELLIEAHYPKE